MEKNYVIFDISEIDLINWSVLIGSQETIRLNVDGSKAIVEYIGSTMPASIQNLSTKSGPYTQDQALQIMETSEWFQLDENDNESLF